MTYSMRLAFAVVAGMIFAGCVQQDDGSPQGHQQERPASTARIVCLRHDEQAPTAKGGTEAQNGNVLTRVLTPKVAAHPDGVHYQIDNRLPRDTTYTTDDFGGARISRGTSNHVREFSPGRLDITCDPPGNYDPGKTKSAYFEIVVGDSSYKSTELECKSGATPTGTYMSATPSVGATPEKIGPIERAREHYSGQLKEGDVVEVAGYPAGRAPRPVRVVREGQVVAVMDYDDWSYKESHCQGQF